MNTGVYFSLPYNSIIFYFGAAVFKLYISYNLYPVSRRYLSPGWVLDLSLCRDVPPGPSNPYPVYDKKNFKNRENPVYDFQVKFYSFFVKNVWFDLGGATLPPSPLPLPPPPPPPPPFPDTRKYNITTNFQRVWNKVVKGEMVYIQNLIVSYSVLQLPGYQKNSLMYILRMRKFKIVLFCEHYGLFFIPGHLELKRVFKFDSNIFLKKYRQKKR